MISNIYFAQVLFIQIAIFQKKTYNINLINFIFLTFTYIYCSQTGWEGLGVNSSNIKVSMSGEI